MRATYGQSRLRLNYGIPMTQGDAAPGTLPADAASGARMAPAVTEAALYAQLAHFARLLDADAALARVRDEAEREVMR